MNRFAELAAKEEATKKKRGKKKSPGEDDGVQDVPTLNTESVFHVSTKGFKQVVAKRNAKPPEKKAEEKKAAQAAKKERKLQEHGVATEGKGKQKLVGATLVDPKQQKAELKAARKLQQHYASQSVKPIVGDAITKQSVKAAKAAGPSEASVKEKKKEEEATKKDAQALQKMAKVVAQAQTKGRAFVDPLAPPPGLEKVSNEPMPQWQTEEVGPSLASLGGKKKGQGQQQQQQQSKGKKGAKGGPAVAQDALLQKLAEAHAAAATGEEEEEAVAKPRVTEDGIPIPIVSFVFLLNEQKQKGKQVPLSTRPNSGKLNEQAVAAVVKHLQSAAGPETKGGLFVEVAPGKLWSNENTVDFPWMCESYFKALLPLVEGAKKETVAYPFWPVIAGPLKDKNETAEAEAKIRKISADVFEIEHIDSHCSARVPVKKSKVCAREFVAQVIREGKLLIQFIEAAKAQMKAEEWAKVSSIFPQKLHTAVESLEEAWARVAGAE